MARPAPVARELDHDRNPVTRGEDPRYATPDSHLGRGYHGLYNSPRLGPQRVAGERGMGGPQSSHYRKINNNSHSVRSRGR
jgi:hypothetical protein